jgi:hypothetical protein
LISLHGREFFRKGTQSFFGIKEGKSQEIMESLIVYGKSIHHTGYSWQELYFFSAGWMVRGWHSQSTVNFSSLFFSEVI